MCFRVSKLEMYFSTEMRRTSIRTVSSHSQNQEEGRQMFYLFCSIRLAKNSTISQKRDGAINLKLFDFQRATYPHGIGGRKLILVCFETKYLTKQAQQNQF
jgi:hypothetical protein